MHETCEVDLIYRSIELSTIVHVLSKFIRQAIWDSGYVGKVDYGMLVVRFEAILRFWTR